LTNLLKVTKVNSAFIDFNYISIERTFAHVMSAHVITPREARGFN